MAEIYSGQSIGYDVLVAADVACCDDVLLADRNQNLLDHRLDHCVR